MSVMNYWRLADELTVTQASLLICGHDPSVWVSKISEHLHHTFPTGYYPSRCAITARLRSDPDFGESVFDGAEIDPSQSIVYVDKLKSWLWSKGVREGFFFPASEATRDYLDPEHPRYAPHLAAAVMAWEALDDPALLNGRTPKQASDKWLREQAAVYSLLNEADGTHNNKAIERISQVTNWAPQGGVAKTPGGITPNLAPGMSEEAILKLPAPEQDVSGNSSETFTSDFVLDDEIPF